MVFFGSILALCGLVLISNGQSLAKNHATINVRLAFSEETRQLHAEVPLV